MNEREYFLSSEVEKLIDKYENLNLGWNKFKVKLRDIITEYGE